MKCEVFEERISFYMDREMDEKERDGWTEHLAGCSTCRELLAAFRGVDSLVAELKDPALRTLTPQDIEEKGKRRRRFPTLRLAASMGTILFILAGLLLLPALREGKQGGTLPPITFMELTRPPEAHYTLTLNDSAYRLKVYGEEVTLLSCDISEKDRESEAELSITFKDTKKR